MKKPPFALKPKSGPQHNREARDMWKRIKTHDYEAVFAHGGCFHFALRLHERFGYAIRGFEQSFEAGNPNHVWCVRPEGGKAIDIRGVYEEELIIRLANGGEIANAFDVSPEELRRIINLKRYSPALDRKVCELADWVVESHERFEGAQPFDSELLDQCLKEISELASE